MSNLPNTRPTDRHYPRLGLNIYVALLLLVALVLAGLTVGAVKANADGHKVQPYGGCDEAWQAPHSIGARECRSLGWTVSRRLVVSPRGVVKMSTLPWCAVEDASSGRVPCSWNFGQDADRNRTGHGLAFWVGPKGGMHFVWSTSPVGRGWHFVPRSFADALAEGGTPGADRRDWSQCVNRIGVTYVRVACADGMGYRIHV